ncbi:MerR family transcriptional regulator [Microcoleus sp. F8-D3]|uniref:MerR family transcriptional regulator n=1 Tax=unclassified Microcoleus TaxID=2642155 RepID=UPI002FD29D82
MTSVTSYNIAEAAKLLHVTPQTLLNWKERGWIWTEKLPNGRYLVPSSEIERLTKTQPTQAVGGPEK